MKKVVLASALLLSLGTVQAAESPRWDSASISYQSADWSGLDLTGFGLSGTKLLGKDIFVAGSYDSVSDDTEVFGESYSFGIDTLSLGVGYRYALFQSTDVFGVVSYEDIEIEASFSDESFDESQSGYGLTLGVRSMLTENVELTGSLQYLDIADGTDTVFDVSALYNFTESFSAGVGYSSSDLSDTLSISGVYFF